MALVSQTDIEAFRRDGVLLVRGMFADWVAPLQAGVATNLAEPGPDARKYLDEENRLFLSDYCNWARIAEYDDFARNSDCAALAAELMGSRTARLFHEHALIKTAGANVPTPWHHDQPYYCVDGNQNVSVWLPLDPIPREISVEFIAGSHAWGRTFQPQRFSRAPLYEGVDTYEELPDFEAERDSYDIRGFELEPGDAICFHFMTVHGAPANLSKQRARRAVSFRFVGDDATFARRPGMTSPPFHNVRLEHGAPMEAPEFPLLWPRAA
jgi:ectoine hydroxylase-related dioxygenase (phytanoyl-CoA dioxygenase family)